MATPSPEVLAIGAEIAGHMHQIDALFKDASVTVLIRNPGLVDGDMVISAEEDLGEAIDAIRGLMIRHGDDPPDYAEAEEADHCRVLQDLYAAQETLAWLADIVNDHVNGIGRVGFPECPPERTAVIVKARNDVREEQHLLARGMEAARGALKKARDRDAAHG